MSAYCVYLLRREDSNRPIYVGQTANPSRRLQEHLSGKCKSTAHAVMQANREGTGIRMQVIAQFPTRQEAIDLEGQLIYRAFCRRFRLENHEHRAKLSA